ncbi:MAG: SGNH/GDSL hydrolase family protein, partial [Ruminococcaceae bacterium]|nr:SGNH/GDSL hydrolase family protein [Oscillospiraceae bacterium]
YANRLARMLSADVYNRAIGGDTFFTALLEAEEVCRPDIVTVAYGTNDWWKHNPVKFAKECGEFYRKLSEKFPAAKIFAVTPIWRSNFDMETPFGAPTYETEAVIRRCTQNLPNVTVIPGWNLVPHHEGFMADKSLHPNDLGFAEYARNLYEAMKKFL